MSDEEIIKRRLLIDGDGTGEDRRLNMLLKQYLKWTYSKNDSPENNQVVYDRLLAQLAQCQFAAAKNEYTSNMIEQELENYNKLSDKIDESIEHAKKEIEESKRELVIAKEIRKNKMQYDMLAKVIQEHPDREETIKEIQSSKKELFDLMQQKTKLERKFEKRRKDFTLLMYCIRELESQLEDNLSESSRSDDENGDDDSDDIVEDCQKSQRTGSEEDENQPSTSSKTYKRHADERTEESTKTVRLEEGDSSEKMSVDEDTVLELSIDKDEHDVVKLEEPTSSATPSK